MRLFKSLALSLFITTFFVVSLGFCDENIKLTPSGNVVDMNILLKYPYVVSRLSNKEDKLQPLDIILCVEHKKEKFKSIKKMQEIMKLSKENITVEFLRDGNIEKQKMMSDELRTYKFKDTIYGAGTITAIDKHGNYVGLAHSIKLNEKDKVSIVKGIIYETSYVQEVKSQDGKVGHLETSSTSKKIGTVDNMTEYGIKGKYNKFKCDPSKALEIGNPKLGKAYIYCETPVTNEFKLHEIEITEVREDSSSIKIKDKSLINFRGGGVVGMSGSPIIQDNKIVGGFRYIVVSDATRGGIANIHSMLENE